MFTQQEFSEKIDQVVIPEPGIRKGLFWLMLWRFVKPIIFKNAVPLLGLILEHLFGKEKAAKIIAFIKKLEEIKDGVRLFNDGPIMPGEESPTCNKNDPNDPHYGEAGEYDENCVWIPEV